VLRLPKGEPGPWELYRRNAFRKVMFSCYLLRRQSSLLYFHFETNQVSGQRWSRLIRNGGTLCWCAVGKLVVMCL
jgi:hypothetical protein